MSAESWREVFAEAQVPSRYDEIMGCAKFQVGASVVRASFSLDGTDGCDKLVSSESIQHNHPIPIINII